MDASGKQTGAKLVAHATALGASTGNASPTIGRSVSPVPTEQKFVQVDLHADTSGHLRPTAIWWDDGRVFPIERIVRTEPVSNVEWGRRHYGTRYTVLIAGHEKELYHDVDGSGRWYVRAPIRYIHDELCQIPPRDIADWPASWAGGRGG